MATPAVAIEGIAAVMSFVKHISIIGACSDPMLAVTGQAIGDGDLLAVLPLDLDVVKPRVLHQQTQIAMTGTASAAAGRSRRPRYRYLRAATRHLPPRGT